MPQPWPMPRSQNCSPRFLGPVLARPGDGPAEEVGELLERLEALLAADAAAAADDDPRRVESSCSGGRLFAASNADGEVLVAERRRELFHPRRQTAGPCLDRVRRD